MEDDPKTSLLRQLISRKTDTSDWAERTDRKRERVAESKSTNLKGSL